MTLDRDRGIRIDMIGQERIGGKDAEKNERLRKMAGVLSDGNN